MKTLADAKRAMVPGSKWRFTADFLSEPTERTVLAVKTTGVGFTSLREDSDGPSWLYWPKASAVEVRGDVVTITDECFPSYWLRYERIE